MNISEQSKRKLLVVAVSGVLGTAAILGSIPEAMAGGTNIWTRASSVTDIVTDNGGGSWSYDFTVFNNSVPDPGGDSDRPLIIDWELPYFSDAGIDLGNIDSPNGWDWSIETIGVFTDPNDTGWGGEASWQDPLDPFYAGAASPYTTVTEVLHWYCEFDGFEGQGCFGNVQIDPFNSLAGFGFDAAFGPTAAPYQASWATLPVLSGDPAFPGAGVGSPNALGIQAVPEPGTLALLSLGLFGAYGLSRRRKEEEDNS